MIESLAVSALPALFLAVLYGGEALMWRRKIDSAGRPAVGKGLLSVSKFAIIVPWGAMVLRSWGLGIDLIGRPLFLKWIALILWGLGFALLLLGRFSLGTAFRVGLAKEKTRLEQNGIYRYSRNPMYLGIYLTLLSASFYTLNPVVLAVGVFIAAVHHRIILAEERELRSVFGAAYEEYCRRVRRYV